MSQPVWQTPAGNLGTIPEGVFYQIPLVATADNTVYYQLIAGALPQGMQIDETGIIAGIPNARATIQGVPADVSTDTASKFAIRAFTRTGSVVNRLADRTFILNVTDTNVPVFNTPPGQIAQYFDATLVTDLQIRYTGPDATVVRLASGSLPPGLSIDFTGKISGLIALSNQNNNYSFTLELTDGRVGGTALRAFSIYVWTRAYLSADNTYDTADNTFITADGTPVIIPVLLNPPGSIGSTRSDNFFAYKFNGVDLSGDAFEYYMDQSLPGLTLDPNSGWLYGTIPPLGINYQTYTFNVYLVKAQDSSITSLPYAYSLTVTGPVTADITWLVPDNLGTIDNGATSTFYVAAVNRSGVALQYQLLSGSDSRLPQGLQLLPTGEIAGRVSFNTFALDQGTTTFDKNTTTFDLVCRFTVNAYSTDGLVNANNTFSITVDRAYNEPYDNLYILAMPPINDRVVINSLLQNSDIFKQDLIYRPTDPNFGVAKNVKYYHAYGLGADTIDNYVTSLDINHYWKNLVLGSVEVAQAVDATGTVIYEVVYSRVIDDLVNAQGQSVSKQVTLPYTVGSGPAAGIATVYPNSLINMRDQVIDVVGQISNVLPLWMICKQANGQTLGFTPAWVIAYAKPGRGEQLAYYIEQNFTDQLNKIDFEVDRYELDNLLTRNWDREQQYWGPPHPASLTTFDLVGLPAFSYTQAYQVGDVVQYQTVEGAAAINKLYVCLTATTPGTVPTNTAHWSSNGRNVASWINNENIITNWTDDNFTLAEWTYATPPGTTFDGGSMQFTAPVDMYSSTDAYDRYLLFPRRDILSPINSITAIDWVNNGNQLIRWINESDYEFVWVTGNV
jgi:hypothetical protein